MKIRKLILGFFVLFCVAALFWNCDNGSPTNEPDVVTIEDIQVPAGVTKYYSLSTGEEVTDPAAIASKSWDLAFKRTRLLLTNSGVTATGAGSGGLGGVYLTGSTDFDPVSLDDKIGATYAGGGGTTSLNTDVSLYTSTGMGAPSALDLNVMTYVGFGGGTGTQADPYTPYSYNASAYYSSFAMTDPTHIVYPMTEKVYLIRHGDGAKWSKLQVVSGEYFAADSTATPATPARDVYTIKYQNLN